jgi:hypothetical protein
MKENAGLFILKFNMHFKINFNNKLLTDIFVLGILLLINILNVTIGDNINILKYCLKFILQLADTFSPKIVNSKLCLFFIKVIKECC